MPVEQSIGSLYSDHHHWLQSWLRKHTRCPHQAEDLAQDTFVRVLAGRSWSGLREPRAYLTVVARGLMIDHFRRRDLELAYLADLALLPEALQPSPEAQHIVLEELQALDRMLDGLSPRTRAAWLLSRLDGHTHAEIAAFMSVSVPRVRQYLAKAAEHCYRLRFGHPERS